MFSNSVLSDPTIVNPVYSYFQNYEWAIGSSAGWIDIQGFQSTGNNPSGIKDNLDGILKHKDRYYISVKCTNEAGLTTLFEDMKGLNSFLNVLLSWLTHINNKCREKSNRDFITRKRILIS